MEDAGGVRWGGGAGKRHRRRSSGEFARGRGLGTPDQLYKVAPAKDTPFRHSGDALSLCAFANLGLFGGAYGSPGAGGPLHQPDPLDTSLATQIRSRKCQSNLYLERTCFGINVRVGRLHNLALGIWAQCGADWIQRSGDSRERHVFHFFCHLLYCNSCLHSDTCSLLEFHVSRRPGSLHTSWCWGFSCSTMMMLAKLRSFPELV